MAKRSEFVEYLLEQLAPLGTLRAKAMFGGWGIYCDERIFALVDKDQLYFKADAETIPDFTGKGLGPFTYPKKDGTLMSMAYYTAPADALEDQAELLQWARAALGVALRAAHAKPPKKKS